MDNIGYLRVVGIGPGDVKSQSDIIRQGLLDLNKKGIHQWIVDLRFNGGGNIEPMISGLAPLIGNGFVSGAINQRGEVKENGYDIISEDMALIISQGVFIDRNKVRYDHKVPVDDFIEFQHIVDLKNDNQVTRAIEWLKE